MSSIYQKLSLVLLMAILLLPMAAAEPDVQAPQAEAWAAETEEIALNGAEADAVPAAKHFLSVQSNMTYTVNVAETLEISFPAGGFKSFSSNDTKVADVVDKDAETGTAQIVARKAGTAKLKAKLRSGKKLSVKLKVLDPYAPQSVSFAEKKVALTVGDTLRLEPALAPETAVTTYTWSSGKKKVATVSSDGLVTAVKAGKAKITVKTANGRKAAVTVTVTDGEKPQAVRLPDALVGVDETVALTPEVTPATARTSFSWSTSDKKVAAVSADGAVTGVKAGTAKITVKTGNGLKATCAITVSDAPATGAKYRALLVANDDFYWGDEAGWDRGTLNYAAASALSATLRKVSGPSGGRYAVTLKRNLSKSGLSEAISKAFAGADADDVSLFYFASHGDSFSTGDDAGALLMASVDKTFPEYARLNEVRDWLLAVPGKVIVLLDTCGSGAAVYSKNGQGDSEAEHRACADFDAAVARAFAQADPGIVEGEIAANTGELRQSNKFYVLCSSRYREDSWAYTDSDKGGSYFTDWLVEGIGSSGDMPADEKYSGNRNDAVDLYELFKYVSAVGDKFAIEFDGTDFYQHVQVYPSDTRYELFR